MYKIKRAKRISFLWLVCLFQFACCSAVDIENQGEFVFGFFEFLIKIVHSTRRAGYTLSFGYEQNIELLSGIYKSHSLYYKDLKSAMLQLYIKKNLLSLREN